MGMEHSKPLLDGYEHVEDPHAASKEHKKEEDGQLVELQRKCYELFVANPTGVSIKEELKENVMMRSLIDIRQIPQNPEFILAYEMGFKEGISFCWKHGDVHAKRIAGVNG